MDSKRDRTVEDEKGVKKVILTLSLSPIVTTRMRNWTASWPRRQRMC